MRTRCFMAAVKKASHQSQLDTYAVLRGREGCRERERERERERGTRGGGGDEAAGCFWPLLTRCPADANSTALPWLQLLGVCCTGQQRRREDRPGLKPSCERLCEAWWGA